MDRTTQPAKTDFNKKSLPTISNRDGLKANSKRSISGARKRLTLYFLLSLIILPPKYMVK